MKISVCMASYNGEKYLKEQIDSILKQLNDTDELIISDDKSSDNTLSIINDFKDKRIRLFINEGKNGYTKNFENALRHARGDLIFLSDQDDIWLDNKISTMSKALEVYDFVVSDSIVVNKDLEVIYESRFEICGVRSGFINNFVRTRYIGCCMAFNRKVLEVVLPFPTNTSFCPHDYWVALVSEMFFKTELIKQSLLLYRRHGNNASSGGFEKGRSLTQKITGRCYCFYKLLERTKKAFTIKQIHKNV